jgi:hypothetical protein
MKVFKHIILCGLFAAVNICNTAFAQVNCTGTVSTGQNLVTNGDFSNLYSGWTHDPAYTNYAPCSTCYSVPGNIYAGSVPSSFNQAFANIQDHSTSGDNNFLMVDGICTVGIDLWKQTNIPIVPNTNYYFSVWITSLSPADTSISGTLNFNINGVDLSTRIAAPGVVGQWVRFPGVVWNSGLNPPSTISISIQNTTVNGCATAVDFGIDDITFTQGCDFGVTGPQPNLGADFPICGRTLPFNINPNFKTATAASPNMTYTWYKDGVQQTKGMGPSFYNFSVTTAPAPGSSNTYSVCVDSAGSCPKLDEIVINNSTTPPSRAWSPDSVFCTGSTSSVRLRIVGGSGSNLKWYTGSCGGTQVASNTTGAEVSVTAPTVTTTYYARWESTGCSTTCASVTVIPKAPPATSVAGPAQNLCNATSATLAANTASPSGATGAWSVVSGTGSITTPSDPNSTVTGLVAGDLVLRWTISNAPCPVSQSQVTIHKDVLSAPVITGASPNQCASATGVVYSTTVNNSPTSTYAWTKTGSIVITGSSNNSVTVNVGATGGTLTVTETKGACSFSASTTITATQTPDLSNAGPRQDLCNAVTATLAANTPSASGASGLWSVVSGTGTVTTLSDPHSTVTGLVAGDLVLKWTISNAPCAVSQSQVTIHTDALSAPVITGASPNQCASATAVVYSTTVNNSGTSTYAWTKTGTIVITGSSNNSVTVNVGATGGTLTVTETKGACSLSASTTITATQTPDLSNAGPRQDLCNAVSATLAANTPSASGASGLWSVVSGTGNVTSPSDPHSTVTGLVEGDLVLKWTISNGSCAPSSSQVTIHTDVLSAPSITGASPSQCATATGVNYSTTVNHAPTSTYTWSKTGSLVITSHPANTAVVNVGSSGGTLTVTETKGACSFSSSINIISVQPLTSTSAGPDQQICNSSSVTLAATAPAAPSVGFWKIISGTGTIAAADTTKFNAPVTGIGAGDLLLRWTIRNSPCADSSDDVLIHQDVLSAPLITGASPNQCATATGVTYSTTVNNSPVSTYVWTKTGSLVITSHPANTAVVDIGASGGTLTVTETKGACSFSSSTNITSVQPLTATSAGSDQQICNASSVTLAATAPVAPSIGFWKIISGTGNIAASDTTKFNAPLTGLLPGDLVTLRWTIRNSPCADSTDDVTVVADTLSAPILSLAGGSYDTCALTTGVTYSTTVNHAPGSTYTWATSGAPNTLVITSAVNNSATLNVGTSGGTLTVTETKRGCSFSASKDITILPNITLADAGSDQSVCLDHTTLQATIVTVGHGEWSVIEGTGNFTDASDAHTSVTGLSQGRNTFRWTVNGCGGPSVDDVRVMAGNSNMVIGPLTGPTDTLCVGTPRTLTLTVSGGSNHYYYIWTSSDSSFNSITTHTPVIVVPLVRTTKYYVYAADSLNYGCISNSDSIEVHAIPGQNLSMNNLMTPNDDNLNDKFIVRDVETFQKVLPGAKLEVYNEWGARVFKSEDYDNNWGAKVLTDGVYYYNLKAGCGGEVYKGWVQIIR